MFWDLGGAQLLRSIWKKYYPDCHGIIFVVDPDYSSNKDELIKTFGINILNQFQSIIIHFIDSLVNSEDNMGVPILVLINKIVKILKTILILKEFILFIE